MDFAVQILISNVSTTGCLKYSFTAASLIELKSTPWKQVCNLKGKMKRLYNKENHGHLSIRTSEEKSTSRSLILKHGMTVNG